jgi:hypothetical protein
MAKAGPRKTLAPPPPREDPSIAPLTRGKGDEQPPTKQAAPPEGVFPGVPLS